jgi:ABC-type dipeptide/oligopeptide/nickel transport system permease subunit
MLHDASSVRVFADFPWLLSPAAAIFLVVLGLNLVLEETGLAAVATGRSEDVQSS